VTLSPLRQAVLAEARTWLRTPYHHAGKVKGPEGVVDCLMLLVAVFQTVGRVPLDFEPRPYAMDWMLHQGEEIYLEGLKKFMTQTDTPLPGDVALYKFGRTASHGGIVTGPDELLHAYRQAGCVTLTDMNHLEPRLHSFWSIE
jgi:NlpC/P60 family putative phage cell wall peptidase